MGSVFWITMVSAPPDVVLDWWPFVVPDVAQHWLHRTDAQAVACRALGTGVDPLANQ